MTMLDHSLGARNSLVPGACRHLVLVVTVVLLSAACGQVEPPAATNTNASPPAPATSSTQVRLAGCRDAVGRDRLWPARSADSRRGVIR